MSYLDSARTAIAAVLDRFNKRTDGRPAAVPAAVQPFTPDHMVAMRNWHRQDRDATILSMDRTPPGRTMNDRERVAAPGTSAIPSIVARPGPRLIVPRI